MAATVERRDFLKKVPLFGAGLALSLAPLAEASETPKVRKLAGTQNLPGYECSQGTVTHDCNTGSSSEGCNTGDVRYNCSQGIEY